MHIESAADLGDGFACEQLGRFGGNHAEALRLHAAELRDHFIRHAVAEVPLAWVAAQIHEGQNSQFDLLSGCVFVKPATITSQIRPDGDKSYEGEQASNN